VERKLPASNGLLRQAVWYRNLPRPDLDPCLGVCIVALKHRRWRYGAGMM